MTQWMAWALPVFCQEKRSYKKDSKIIVQGQRIVQRGQKPIAGQTVPAELFIVLSLLCMNWRGKSTTNLFDKVYNSTKRLTEFL